MGQTPGWPDEPNGVYQKREPGREGACCLACVLLVLIGGWLLLWWTAAHAARPFV